MTPPLALAEWESDLQPHARMSIARWFADDTRFWSLSALLLACIAVLKGLRVPSLWAATQAQFDYHTGFIKRGLLGQAASALGLQIAHYEVFVGLSSVLFLCFIALLVRSVWTSAARRLADGSVVAVFTASYALTYMTHLIGYFEIVSAALALAVILMSGSSAYLIAVLAAGVVGVLVHENYVLTFLPVTLLPALLRSASTGRYRLRELAPTGAVVAVIAIVVLIVAWGAPMSAQQVNRLQAAMAANADFHPRDDFFPVLTRSASANVLIMMSTMRQGAWWLAQATAFIAFMPTAAFFLWITLKIVNVCHQGADRWILKTAVVAASLCPLLLQIVGWDIYRWYALAGFNSFLVLAIVCRHYDSPAVALSTDRIAVRNLAILLIAINMATGTGLFDGYRVDTFPFVDHWRAVIRWLDAGGHWEQPAT